MRQNKTNLKYKAGPIRFSRHIKCAVDRVIPGDDWGQGGLDMRTYWLKSKWPLIRCLGFAEIFLFIGVPDPG